MIAFRGMYIRNIAYIPQNLKDIRIADMNELSKMPAALERLRINRRLKTWI